MSPVLLHLSSLQRDTLSFPRTKKLYKPALTSLLLPTDLRLRAGSPLVLYLVFRPYVRLAASVVTARKSASVFFHTPFTLIRYRRLAPSVVTHGQTTYPSPQLRLREKYSVLLSHGRTVVSPLLFFPTTYVFRKPLLAPLYDQLLIQM